MRVLPVLDLMGGEVVRGVAGRRREYRPVVSRLSASGRPRDVADGFRTHFGLKDLYVADLDAITGRQPAWPVYADLRAVGFRLWIDAGVREVERATRLIEEGVESVVVGLETIAGPDGLEAVCHRFGDRIVFSLDLKAGRPLGDASAWGDGDAWSIAARAVALGVRRLLVLDLARVGTAGGTGTEDLCARLTATYPELEVSAGGGVRGLDDLRRLKAIGVRAALVASALHDGALRREDVEGVSEA